MSGELSLKPLSPPNRPFQSSDLHNRGKTVRRSQPALTGIPASPRRTAFNWVLTWLYRSLHQVGKRCTDNLVPCWWKLWYRDDLFPAEIRSTIREILNGDRHVAHADDMCINRHVKNVDQVFVDKIFHFLKVINAFHCHHYWSISKQTANFERCSLGSPDIPPVTSLKQTFLMCQI